MERREAEEVVTSTSDLYALEHTRTGIYTNTGREK